MSIKQIVSELVTELEGQFSLPRRKISSTITLSAYRSILALKLAYFLSKRLPKLYDLTAIVFKDITSIETLEGKPIPKYRIEILKDLIRKAAMKKLARLEEGQAQKIKERKN
jgi:hypothetical protein